MTRLFVYGTLRKPGRNHHYLKTADFITKAQVKGCLYWIQGLNYPALLEGEEWISGELYEVDAPTEVRLDELEGYIAIDHPDNLYHKKQMDIVKPEDLGVDVKPRLKTLKVVEPPKRSAGIKVPDVATLVAKLKTEAKVI